MHVVEDGRDADLQLGQANVGEVAALVNAGRLGVDDLVLQVVFDLPGVAGMGFLNVNDVEGRPILVLIVKLVERGNLPAKGRSSVAAEDEHNGLLPAERGKLHPALAVVRLQAEVRGRITHA